MNVYLRNLVCILMKWTLNAKLLIFLTDIRIQKISKANGFKEI